MPETHERIYCARRNLYWLCQWVRREIKMLLQLKDGAILNLSESRDKTNGCETCDFGARFTQDFTVETDQGNMIFYFNSRDGYGVSEAFLLKVFLSNVEAIKNMTVSDLFKWLKTRFIEEAGNEVDATFYKNRRR
jgi:hypothetical protein